MADATKVVVRYPSTITQVHTAFARFSIVIKSGAVTLTIIELLIDWWYFVVVTATVIDTDSAY